MGINDIFNIASRGIAAQRVAIEVTSENISNVNTPGYSRQRTIMESGPANSGSGFPIGSGVQVAAIERSYDNLLQSQIVNGNSTYQQNLAKQTALQQVEPIVNELTTDGLGKAMDNFFGAWQDLSANPQGSAERQTLISRSQVLTDTFHQMNSSLTSVVANSDTAIQGITSEITDKAKNIASLNSQILTTEQLGGNSNELRDQRDYLVQELAKKVGITTAEQSNGTLNINLPGGEALVNGTQYATVYTNPNTAVPPTNTNDIFVTPLGNPPPANTPATDKNVTATIGGTNNGLGEIGGTLQVRDTIVPGYIKKLDEMANQLVTTVNTQHQSGYALDGTSGNNFFDPAGTASGSINLDSGLTTTKIAAGLPTLSDPAPTSSGNNGNALKLADLKNSSITFSTGNATVNGFYNAFVSKVGIDVQSAKNSSSQGEAFLKQLNNLRDSNSAVSLDEELTNLTKYQRAFEGAAKLINAGTDMMDTVLGLIK